MGEEFKIIFVSKGPHLLNLLLKDFSLKNVGPPWDDHND